MKRSIRTAVIVAVASCAAPSLVGLASAQALAATTAVKIGGYKVVEKTFSLPAGGFVRNTAPCPAGKVVLGGGAAVVGAGSANFGTVVRESEPGTVGGGTTSLWLAAVSNQSSTNRTLGIFAVCATKPKGYKVVEKTFSLPAGGFVRDTALCPAKKVVLGGGAAVVGGGSANFGTVVQESSPGTIGGGAKSLWLAAVSIHSATKRTLGIFAVCATKPTNYKVVEDKVSLPAGGFVRSTALCPAGKVVLGGGSAVVGAGTGNFATEVQESDPGTVGGGATSLWLAAVSNHSRSSRTLGIFAVCAAKK
jgi:hypothetical protein